MVIEVKNPKAATPATPATPAHKSAAGSPPPAPADLPTGPTAADAKAQREQWAKDAEAAKKKADSDLQAAHGKASKANANLAKQASGLRVEPEIREGQTRYKWGNFVPTRFLTDDEVKALEDMK